MTQRHKSNLRVDEQGRLVIPPEVATRMGFKPGQRLTYREDAGGLQIIPSADCLRRVYVEPTNQCNFYCRTCMRNVWAEAAVAEAAGTMSMETFQRVLDGLRSFDPLPDVFFGGYGEPLTHPELFDMVAAAKRQGLKTELITNATLLDEKSSLALIEAGLGRLWVSLDGATPESYADVRLGDALPQVITNLEHFQTLLSQSADTSPRLGIAFVALKRNIRDLPEILRLGRRLGADRFSISNLLAHSGDLLADALYHPGQPISEASPLVQMPRMEINAETRETLIQVLQERMRLSIAGQEIDLGEYRCPFVSKGSLSVRWDGSVSPCLPLLHSHTQQVGSTRRSVSAFSLGCLRDQSLAEIWHLSEYRELRERLLAFDFSPCVYCSSCEMAEANTEDCFGNVTPACGGCLWAQGFIQCP